MTGKPLWEPCIHHRAIRAEEFVDEFFGQQERRVLMVGAAGFDPRSSSVAERLAAVCGDRLSGFFIREERPNATDKLKRLADENDTVIRRLVADAQIFQVEVFGIDSAPVGGRRATMSLHKTINTVGFTDLVLDCSALSVGVMFPIGRYCFETAKRREGGMNFHILVRDDPVTDSVIQASSCGMSSPLHTFSGGLNLDQNTGAARLWLPQLGTGRREVLNLIYQDVQPHAVCPVIPFPSTRPRAGDELIEEYGDLFDAISGPMTPTWHVDSRDLVFAHEKNPLDLYRSILRIADARKRVFFETGGSQLILSPLGSKAVSLGMLMAALDRGFAVVSVESIEYRLTSEEDVRAGNDSELVHVWLHGEAYPQVSTQQEAPDE